MTDLNNNQEPSLKPVSASKQTSGSSLIDTLMQLYFKISHKLCEVHLGGTKMGKTRESIDIWGRLGEHVERTPVVEHGSETPPPMTAHAQYGNSNGSELIANELGDYYSRGHNTPSHPHISDQMRSKTFEHISLSLHLARRGDKEGARLHIELAENAMRTASQFMKKDEYLEFRLQVEDRLESIVQNGHN